MEYGHGYRYHTFMTLRQPSTEDSTKYITHTAISLCSVGPSRGLISPNPTDTTITRARASVFLTVDTNSATTTNAVSIRNVTHISCHLLSGNTSIITHEIT